MNQNTPRSLAGNASQRCLMTGSCSMKRIMEHFLKRLRRRFFRLVPLRSTGFLRLKKRAYRSGKDAPRSPMQRCVKSSRAVLKAGALTPLDRWSARPSLRRASGNRSLASLYGIPQSLRPHARCSSFLINLLYGIYLRHFQRLARLPRGCGAERIHFRIDSEPADTPLDPSIEAQAQARLANFRSD